MVVGSSFPPIFKLPSLPVTHLSVVFSFPSSPAFDQTRKGSIANNDDNPQKKASSLRSMRQSPEDQQRRQLATTPIETYFLPAGETQLLDTMNAVNANAASPLRGMSSLAIAASNTVVWYDHAEDGYEGDILNPVQLTTRIWGDGLASNGCAPPLGETGYPACTDANDVLDAGTVILLDEDVPVPRDSSVILYDGGDRIQSSFPIAVTRGVHSGGSPGALLGGAVEVHNMDSWGTSFKSPIGIMMQDDATDSFSITEMYVMAAEDNTVVTLPGGPFDITKPNGDLHVITNTDPAISESFTLNMGETLRVSKIKVDDSLTSTKPVQVDLITGDQGSNYEMRWYSLLPVDLWTNDYYTPVGDTNSRVYCYNPHDFDFKVNYDNIEKNQYEHNDRKGELDLKKGETKRFEIPREGSGYRFYSKNGLPTETFFCVTQTDDVGGGQANDWGHPLIPTSTLTSKVIVGLAYGCRDPTNCPITLDHPPNPIWLTPTEDADIRIDFDSDGIIDQTIPDVLAMQSVYISDSDKDMSGATIYAVGNVDNTHPVPIAVAWGQAHDLTLAESYNLDMGTTILPLPVISAEKTCEVVEYNICDGLISPGATLRCTIRVVNMGTTNTTSLKFCETLDQYVTYVPGSTLNGEIQVVDSGSGTAFPLDDTCLTLTNLNIAVGEYDEISFNVTVADFATLPQGYETLTDTGSILDPLNADKELTPLDTRTQINHCPAVTVTKTVVLGADATCPGTSDTLTGVPEGSTVTYCYNVMNTGSTGLADVSLTDPTLGVNQVVGTLEIGQTFSYQVNDVVTATETTTATATGNPVYSDLTADMPTEVDVTSTDSASVQLVGATASPTRHPTLPPEPGITILKTVATSAAECEGGRGTQQVTVPQNTTVYFCFLITNTGATDLYPVRLYDKQVDLLHNFPSTLSPGHSFAYVHAYDATSGVLNEAQAFGQVPDTSFRVTDSDTAEVILQDKALVADEATITAAPATTSPATSTPTSSPSSQPSLMPSSTPTRTLTSAPVGSGPLFIDESEPLLLESQGTPGDSVSPTAGPTYLVAAASPSNTICKTVNMTATQPIEIRSFMFYVETTDCISVSVQYKGENDTLWTPMCLEHDVWGQHPNATVVDPAYCSMISVLLDEAVQFRVQTSPSNGCVYGEGAVQHTNLDLGELYVYSETECS